MAKSKGSHTDRQSAVITTRINPATQKAFDEICQELNTSRASLALQIILDFIENPRDIKDRDLRAVQEAIDTIKEMDTQIERFELLARTSADNIITQTVLDMKRAINEALEKLDSIAQNKRLDDSA